MKLFDTAALKTWYELSISRKVSPIYLVTITSQGTTQRFAVSRKDIVFGGNTYTGGELKISSFRYTSNLDPDSLSLSLKNTNAQFSSYIMANRIGLTGVTVQKVFNDDLSAGVYYQMFVGRVISVAADNSSFVLTCQSTISHLQNNFLRLITKITCNHLLYGYMCGVDENSSYSGFNFKHTTVIASLDITISSLTLSSVTSSGGGGLYPDDYFSDGFVRFTKDGYTQRLHILKYVQSTKTLVLLSNIVDAEVGDTIELLAGCDFSHTTCLSRFNNLARNLSFPLIPRRNPTTDGAKGASAEGTA